MSPEPKGRVQSELESAPPVDEAVHLLFRLFREGIGHNLENPLTKKLIDTNILYPEKVDEVYVPRTKVLSPDSPLILSLNVGGAEHLVTVTIAHYSLSFGPDHDLVVARDVEGKDYRAYWYRKGNREPLSTQFARLSSWFPISRLLLRQDIPGEIGTRISFWRRDYVQPTYYSMRRDFVLKQVSLLEFLKQLQSSES